MFYPKINFYKKYKEINIKYSFEDFDQFSTTMALAELQAAETLMISNLQSSSQSAEAYLSEMSKNYSNTGDIRLLK